MKVQAGSLGGFRTTSRAAVRTSCAGDYGRLRESASPALWRFSSSHALYGLLHFGGRNGILQEMKHLNWSTIPLEGDAIAHMGCRSLNLHLTNGGTSSIFGVDRFIGPQVAGYRARKHSSGSSETTLSLPNYLNRRSRSDHRWRLSKKNCFVLARKIDRGEFWKSTRIKTFSLDLLNHVSPTYLVNQCMICVYAFLLALLSQCAVGQSTQTTRYDFANRRRT
jgi:hypothetical protein